MSSAPQQAMLAQPGPGPAAVRVTRSRRTSWWAGVAALVLVVVLGYLPFQVYSDTTDLLVNFFMLLTMATMWNLLAGYAGLVSVGQQAFIGLGAYFVLILAQHGASPFAALPVAAAACGVLGLPVWWLVSRLRSGYFAITTWVIASVCELIIVRYPSLGGGTGAPLPGLGSVSATELTAFTYWAALAVAVVALAVAYLMLRSRLGLELTAVRDDEIGARSLGVRVSRARRLVFMVAAAGCGAAGALLIISQLNVEPAAAFSVQWSAEMIFVTIIGGIGTIEGPIIGTIVFFVLQQTLSSHGTWYFIILGLLAMVIAIWAPRGLWGLFTDRFHIRLFPVGYWLWPAAQASAAPRPWWRPAARRQAGPPGTADPSRRPGSQG
jgi:ABC-type branched-subunit amino acid transport system permease subunit